MRRTEILVGKKLMLVGLALLLIAAGCTQSARRQSTAGAMQAEVAERVRVSPEQTDAAEPAVTAGQDGTVYVVWVEHRAKQEADVWLAHLDAEGKSLGPAAVRVNANAGEATAWRGDPPTAAVAPDGTVYVGWTARVEGAAHASILYLSASRDGGRNFEPPVKVNDDQKPCEHGMHSLAVAPDGHVSVAWLDERNVAPPPMSHHTGGEQRKHMESNREVFFASSVDGGRTFSPNRRIATNVCPCCKTSVATASDGRVYVSWRQVLAGDFRHIAVASSIDAGNSFSEPVIVSDDHWMIPGCPVSGAALAVENGGAVRVLWYSAGEAGAPGLYWSESLDGGRTFAPRRGFAESSGSGSPVLLADGSNNFVTVWEGSAQASTQPMTARLSADGDVTGSAALADVGELPAAALAGEQTFVAYISKSAGHSAIWLTRVRTARS